MWQKALLLFIAWGTLLSLGAAQDDKSYNASRFDVDLLAQHDGSAEVTETVTFNFNGGPFTFVFRELPTDHTDGIEEITASVDGIPWPQGTGPGQVEISGDDPIRVTWHLPQTSNTTHTFQLTYHALGVAMQTDGADVLAWQALPDDYDYTIDSSRVIWTFPTDAELLGTPQVTAGSAELTVEGNQVSAAAQNLEENDPLVIELRFSPGTLISAPPAWQAQEATQQAQQNRFAWIWIALAALIAIGGTLNIVAQARSKRQPVPKVTGVAYDPPGDLPPAMAGLLHTPNGRASWQHALGTLFDLAGRGLLIIEEQPKGKWYESKDWVIKQVNPGRYLRPHEEQLLELLFITKSGVPQESIKMSQISGLLSSSRWKQYTESLEADMKANGLLDAEQKQRGYRLLIGGVIALFLAGVVFVLALILSNTFGYWPLLVAGALFLLSLVAFIIGYSLSVLSESGEKLAAQWEPFYRYLKDVTKRKAAITSPDIFERYLPYAAAFGLLSAWAGHFEKEDRVQPPSYFRTLNTADGVHMGAFVAMIAASSSSGGAAGGAGAAGAGAAGGGASGAG